jgi:hypothetical protein
VRAVIYAPEIEDPPSGTILQMVQGSPSAVALTAEAMSAAWLSIAPQIAAAAFARLDATHRVQAGALIAITPAS